MDQDDEWHPEKLQRQVDAFARYPDAVLVCTDSEKIDGDGIQLSRSFIDGPERNYQQLRPAESVDSLEYFPDIAGQIHLAGWFMLPSAVMVRRSALVDAGMFDERITLHEDVACFLRVLTRGPLVVVRNSLTRWRIHGTNTHRDNLKMLRGRVSLTRDMEKRPAIYPAGYVHLLKSEFPGLLRDVARLELSEGDYASGRRLIAEAYSMRRDAKSAVLLLASVLSERAFRSTVSLRRRFK